MNSRSRLQLTFAACDWYGLSRRHASHACRLKIFQEAAEEHRSVCGVLERSSQCWALYSSQWLDQHFKNISFPRLALKWKIHGRHQYVRSPKRELVDVRSDAISVLVSSSKVIEVGWSFLQPVFFLQAWSRRSWHNGSFHFNRSNNQGRYIKVRRIIANCIQRQHLTWESECPQCWYTANLKLEIKGNEIRS